MTWIESRGVHVIICIIVAAAPWGKNIQAQPTPVSGGSTTPAAGTQSILGQVIDEQGGAIVGAAVTVTDGTMQVSSRSDEEGRFAFRGLQAGTHTLRVVAANFAPESRSVVIAQGEQQIIRITLRIALQKEEITIFSANPLMRGAELSGGSMILRGEALDALPDDPGGLEMMLRALALRTAGPFGPQILVNGFEDGTIPPKESIREIRINDNPFSAEYPQMGLGRVEILTKPGTDKFHNDLYFYFGDRDLNSRNPFATNQPAFQSRIYGGDMSGPIIRKRATFFVDFSRQEDRSNAVINATILDPAFRIVPFETAVVTPERRRSFGPRLDVQLNPKNTLVARYNDIRSGMPNSAIGSFSLPSRSQYATSASQTAQLTETAVLSPTAVNETRVQYARIRSWQNGDNSSPTINVPGAFIGGGADVRVAFDTESRGELQDYLSWQAGRHILKAGLQLRYSRISNGSTQNFGGTYLFNGRLAPQLDSSEQIVANGSPINIIGIEAYQRTLVFQSRGLSPAAIRQLGGGASQFSLTAGQFQARVGQYEGGAFLADEWRLNPKFALNMGLRYENQSNISSNLNFAPRVGFAWGLGKSKDQPRTVVRGGAGIFYDRVGERLVLKALQLNGVNQQQFITSDSSVLDLFPAVPSPSVLAGFAVPASTVQLASTLRAPYAIQSSLAIEHQVGQTISLAATYTQARGVHLLRSRNINAPFPGTDNLPYYSRGQLFEYESSGVLNRHQLLTNFVYRANKHTTLWTTYTFTDSKTDTDGPDTFPASTYDLHGEYGRSSLEARHTVYLGGWFTFKGGIDLAPLLLWRSGLPFNITTGMDNNHDSLFLARPAFATDLSRSSVVMTRWGAFDLNPLPGQQIIPRNYGEGPSFFIVNLRALKKFPVNDRLSITFSAQVQNLLNHTNPGTPIGTLSSPLFGLSNTAAGDWGLGSNQAGNRRIELGLVLSF